MTLTKVYMRHSNVTWRVQASKRIRENYMPQWVLIDAQNRQQFTNAKDMIRAKMNKLLPATQKASLKMRLAAIEEHLKKPRDDR